MLIDGREPPRAELARLAAQLEPGGAMAVAVSGRPPPPSERAAAGRRALRALALGTATLRARLAAARVRRPMRAAGLAAKRIDIGPRNDGYELAIGRGRVRPAVEAVVVGTRGIGEPTLLDGATAMAERALGERLVCEGGRVLASGTLMAELSSAAGGRWLLRLTDADPPDPPAGSAEQLEALVRCDPPGEVRARLVRPLARGKVETLAWSIERKLPGTHPHRMNAAVWEQCVAFLTALATTSVPASGSGRSLAEDAAVLGPHLDPGQRRALELLVTRAGAKLGELPRCWGHGDFHPGNLLVRGERLAAVLDWDAASAFSLPGLDLLHLIATTDPRLRHLPHGSRCTRGLRAPGVGGAGLRLQAHLETVGVPIDPAVIRALLDAYWLTRAARDLRSFADRPEWVELNVRRPLRELGGGP